MSRGVRVVVSVLVAWVVWMIAKSLMPEGAALLVFPAAGVAVWFLTGAIAGRREAVEAEAYEDEEADEHSDR